MHVLPPPLPFIQQLHSASFYLEGLFSLVLRNQSVKVLCIAINGEYNRDVSSCSLRGFTFRRVLFLDNPKLESRDFTAILSIVGGSEMDTCLFTKWICVKGDTAEVAGI